MSPLIDCIENKKTRNNPIWIMRQAGRYLPEFREIRKDNPDFIKLCLNPKLSSEITLQPLKRFNLDAAIIFSDILMIPLGVKQDVKFKKNFGPQLGDINFETIKNISEEEFSNILSPVYDAINITMGLPFLRISPDHGPNKKMYGLNKSNPQSLIQALRFLDKK